MAATEVQVAARHETAKWESGERSTFFDQRLERIPGLSAVYRSLKDWQAECAPRIYPGSALTPFDRENIRGDAARGHRPI